MTCWARPYINRRLEADPCMSGCRRRGEPLFRRAPLIRLDRASEVIALQPRPKVLLVDIEGTLTGFGPTQLSILAAIQQFDRFMRDNGFKLNSVHYVSNYKMSDVGDEFDSYKGRLHLCAGKPFFALPTDFLNLGVAAGVVGDQYLTDGLLAWRYGFSFLLVNSGIRKPLGPAVQFYAGRLISSMFFESPSRDQRRT